jgi:hypothetical protein
MWPRIRWKPSLATVWEMYLTCWALSIVKQNQHYHEHKHIRSWGIRGRVVCLCLFLKSEMDLVYLYNILGWSSFPFVLSSIHPSSSSRKKKMMGDFTVSEGHWYPLVQYIKKNEAPKLCVYVVFCLGVNFLHSDTQK